MITGDELTRSGLQGPCPCVKDGAGDIVSPGCGRQLNHDSLVQPGSPCRCPFLMFVALCIFGQI
jgi:hypothetical protein